MGFMWGVLFPWVISLPLLYIPDMLADVINLTSLIFVSFTDFIVPFCLFVHLQRRHRKQHNTTYPDLLANDTGALSHAVEAATLRLTGGLATSTAWSGQELPVLDEAAAEHFALPASCGPAGVRAKEKVGLAAALGVSLATLSLRVPWWAADRIRGCTHAQPSSAGGTDADSKRSASLAPCGRVRVFGYHVIERAGRCGAWR
eukprot:5521898-Prymnesium_polylepis.1